MKRIFLLSVFGLLVFIYPGLAQDCTFFYPMEKGTLIELKHYNQKAKLQGSTRQEIITLFPDLLGNIAGDLL